MVYLFAFSATVEKNRQLSFIKISRVNFIKKHNVVTASILHAFELILEQPHTR